MPISLIAFYMVSCSSFKLLSLTLRSLIHFEVIFVQGKRKRSSFSLLHVDIQFSQHYLLKKLSLLQRVFGTSVDDKLAVSEWAYFYVFYFIPLAFMSAFVPVPPVFVTKAQWYNLKSGIVIPSVLLFLLRTSLVIWGLLCFHMNFRTNFSISVKNDLRFLWRFHWIVDCYQLNSHFHSIHFVNQWKWEVEIHLLNFFLKVL
jgi:hypothetical protein